MKQYTVTLTLLEDVIISQRSASLGGHRSLDYVPGAVLLGACAGRLYTKLPKQDAYRLFHSGKVRFGNALPLSEAGQLGMPMPLVWFYKKGENYLIKQGSGRQLLDVDKISQHDNDNGEQPVQLRSGYLTGDLEVLKPMQTLRMKTAIDPETARAATSQLFGYQALEAGQRFRATLSADDDVLELAERAAEVLQGTLLLGRSRSAQYGKAGCEVGEAHEPPLLPERLIGAEQLKLWLQADMVLQDASGRPLLHGQSADLPGLPDAQIQAEDSQLRFRRYSPYNGARRGFDMERQAIEKGSVLSLKLGKALDQAQWQVLQAGLGLYRESGLGQVLVDHDLIDSERIKTIKPFNDRITIVEAPKLPDCALARWIQAGVSANAGLDRDKTFAEQSIEELAGLYQRARAYHGVEAHLPIGPTASQWSLVVEAGKRHQRNKEALLTALFDADNGICKDGDESWGIATLTFEGSEIKFADWLKQALVRQGLNDPAYVASLIARMGAEYVKAQKKGARDDA